LVPLFLRDSETVYPSLCLLLQPVLHLNGPADSIRLWSSPSPFSPSNFPAFLLCNLPSLNEGSLALPPLAHSVLNRFAYPGPERFKVPSSTEKPPLPVFLCWLFFGSLLKVLDQFATCTKLCPFLLFMLSPIAFQPHIARPRLLALFVRRPLSARRCYLYDYRRHPFPDSINGSEQSGSPPLPQSLVVCLSFKFTRFSTLTLFPRFRLVKLSHFEQSKLVPLLRPALPLGRAAISLSSLLFMNFL